MLLMVGPDVNYWLDVLPGAHGVRARPVPDGRPADRHGAGRRAQRERRHRQRHQQRGGACRLAAGGGRAARRRRPGRRRLRRRGRLRRRLPVRHHHLRRPADPRRSRLLVHHPEVAGGGQTPIRQRSSGSPAAGRAHDESVLRPHLPWCGDGGSAQDAGRDGRRAAPRPAPRRVRGRRQQRYDDPAPYAVTDGDPGQRDVADGRADQRVSALARARCAAPTSWSSARRR